jgi:hypothetical protein
MDDFRSGVNIRGFPFFLQDRCEVRLSAKPLANGLAQKKNGALG